MSEKETWESHEKSCGGDRFWSPSFNGCFACSTCGRWFKYPPKGDAVRHTEWGDPHACQVKEWSGSTLSQKDVEVFKQAGVIVDEKKDDGVLAHSLRPPWRVASEIAPPVAAKVEKHLCTCSYVQALNGCLCGGR